MTSYVLLTRPEASSREIQTQLSQKSIQSFIEPMMSVQSVVFDTDILAQSDGFIATSANAFKVIEDYIKERTDYLKKPVFTVGDQTADMASQLGFEHVFSASGNVQDLAALMAQSAEQNKKYLYLRGKDISKPLEEWFERMPDFDVEEQIVYETKPVEYFSDKLLNKLDKKEISHVLFFSRRTAEIFKNLVIQHKCTPLFHSIKALCLADSMLEFISEMPWGAVYVSPEPNRQALLSLLENNLENTETVRSNDGQEITSNS